MTQLKNRRIQILCDLPSGVDADCLAEYVCSALEHWGGGFDPQDPLFFGINIRSVEIFGHKFEFEQSK